MGVLLAVLSAALQLGIVQGGVPLTCCTCQELSDTFSVRHHHWAQLTDSDLRHSWQHQQCRTEPQATPAAVSDMCKQCMARLEAPSAEAVDKLGPHDGHATDVPKWRYPPRIAEAAPAEAVENPGLHNGHATDVPKWRHPPRALRPKCSPGQYLPETELTDPGACTQCPTNTYQTYSNHRFPFCNLQPTCGPGKYITTSLKTARQQCVSCPTDTYQTATAHRDTTCKQQTACGAGEFFPGASSSQKVTCQLCATGTYQVETNHRREQCIPHPLCTAGQYLLGGASTTNGGTTLPPRGVANPKIALQLAAAEEQIEALQRENEKCVSRLRRHLRWPRLPTADANPRAWSVRLSPVVHRLRHTHGCRKPRKPRTALSPARPAAPPRSCA